MVFCSNNPRKQIQVEEKRFCVSDLIDRSGLIFYFYLTCGGVGYKEVSQERYSWLRAALSF